MILLIALIIAVVSITGCIRIKKTAVRYILGTVAVFNIVIVILGGSFVYTTKYRINYVDSSMSPDGKYELLLQQIGDPEWPFGYTHARLVLKGESGTITRYPFILINDGGCVRPESWQVSWKKNRVEAVLSGEEQNDIRYTLYFDGKAESDQLDTGDGDIR